MLTTATTTNNTPLIGGILGTVLEWYDFCIYVYLAPILTNLFFPTENKYISLMLVYLVFAVGFLLRPVGGLIFGHLGDKYGRKTTFVLTILLMSVATFLIGLLPTYAQIGIAAPLLLTALRMLQGLSTGGETIGTINFFYEAAPISKRGFYSSLMWNSTGIGLLVSSAVIAIFSHVLTSQQMHEWGWRIPFLLGILTGFAGFFLRRRAEETTPFLEIQAKKEIAAFPLKEILKNHKMQLLKIIMIFIPSGVSFYLFFVFMPTFAAKFANLPLAMTTTINTINLLVLLIAAPLLALMADKIGKKKFLLAGLIGFIIFSLPLYYIIGKGSVSGLFIAQFGFAIISAFYASSSMTFAMELVPTRIRFSIVAIGYSLCYSIFCSTAPLIATYLIYKSHNQYIPAFYLILSALIALPVIIQAREHK